MGGLELWRANLCLKFASSSWPWELLHWTECYLFGHLIHTQKWPLGAVFDKQTDWIACVSMCVVSLPRCPQGPSEMAPIDSRTWKIAHACPLTCPDYTSYCIDTQNRHILLTRSSPVWFNICSLTGIHFEVQTFPHFRKKNIGFAYCPITTVFRAARSFKDALNGAEQWQKRQETAAAGF